MANKILFSPIRWLLGLLMLIIIGILASKFYLNPNALRSEVVQLLTPFGESKTEPSAEIYVLGNKESRFLTTVVQTQLARLSSYKSNLVSSSNLSVEALFKIAAGFDLDKSSSVTVSSFPPSLHVTVSEPEILAIEMSNNKVINDKEGLWSKFSHADHSNMIRSMTAQAKQAAVKGGILEAAKERLEKQIIELAGTFGLDSSEVSIEFLSEKNIASVDNL